MSVSRVVRHDLRVVRHGVTGRLLLGTAVAGGLGGVVTAFLLSDAQPAPAFLSFGMWLVTGTVVPGVALLSAAVSLAAERESGRIRLLFGTPTTRRQLFVGYLVSRTLVAGTAAVLSVVLAAGVMWVGGARAVTPQLLYVYGYTPLVTVVYTAVGVSISAASTSRLRAIALGVTTYVAFALWPHIIRSVLGVGADTTSVLDLVALFSPFGAYSQVVTPARAIYAEPVESWHLTVPVVTVLLCVWIVAPPAVSYWRLQGADLD